VKNKGFFQITLSIFHLGVILFRVFMHITFGMAATSGNVPRRFSTAIMGGTIFTLVKATD
jgi:hypothetical protein